MPLFLQPGVYRLRCVARIGPEQVRSPAVEVTVRESHDVLASGAISDEVIEAFTSSQWHGMTVSRADELARAAEDDGVRAVCRSMGAALAARASRDEIADADRPGDRPADWRLSLRGQSAALREFAALRVATMLIYRFGDYRGAEAVLADVRQPGEELDGLRSVIRYKRNTRIRAHAAAVAPWAAAVLGTTAFAVLAHTRLLLRITARRRRRNECTACGYDLIPSPKPVIAILPGEPQEQQQPTPRP